MKSSAKKVIGLFFTTIFLMGVAFGVVSMADTSKRNYDLDDMFLDTSCRDSDYSFAEWRGDNQRYLYIQASDYYTLGYLTGQYLTYQIIAFDNLIDYFIDAYNLDFQLILYFASQYEIPEPYYTEMLGIAEATGLSYYEILLQHVFLDVYYGILIPLQISQQNIGACTGFAVKNSRQNVVHGQTMDFGFVFFPTFAWVHHKVFGKNEVFSLRMGASSLAIGKNKRVSCTQNLIQSWAFADFGVPTSLKSRIAFETCRTAKDFISVISSSLTCYFNYIVCDKKGNAIALETAPNIVTISHIERKGFAVRTNTYVTEDLKPFLLDPVYSIARQNKAEDLIINAFNQGKKFTIKNGITIECYHDYTDASILRYDNSENLLGMWTLASFATSFRTKGYFGIGTPAIAQEKIPI
ncbi:MAG: carcinine hydrolase/isopenicillin-N N-acyltransferase family protein [Candidatus Hermodarchaeota archaeon]